MSDNSMQFDFHILMGLPMSGKTFFANEMLKSCENDGHVSILTIGDEHLKSDDTLEYVDWWRDDFKRHFKNIRLRNNNIVIIDGLILTKERVHDMKDLCVSFARKLDKHPQIRVIIHKWDNDRDRCYNNAMLKEHYMYDGKDPLYTIKYETFDHIDNDFIDDLQNEHNEQYVKIKLTHHKVPKLTFYDIVLSKYDNTDGDNKMLSKSWIVGEEPVEFDQFDDLLMKFCPDITYLNYKKLRKGCVSTETHEEYSYSGDVFECVKWTCDLKKLYKMALDMKLLEKN